MSETEYEKAKLEIGAGINKACRDSNKWYDDFKKDLARAINNACEKEEN